MGLFVRITGSVESGVAPVQILCDSPHALPHDNLVINGVRVLQFDDLAFAAYKNIRDTGNRLNEVSFDAWRTQDEAEDKFNGFASIAAWSMDHANACPVIGMVEFTMTDAADTITRYFAHGAVQNVSISRLRDSVAAIRYTIVGGEFLKAKPTS